MRDSDVIRAVELCLSESKHAPHASLGVRERGYSIEFGFFDDDTETMAFNGPGGELARATNGTITFDIDENWTFLSQNISDAIPKNGKESFCLDVVCLHEIGHILGLSHSKNPNDVMAPYYDRSSTTLKEEDITRIKALYAS